MSTRLQGLKAWIVQRVTAVYIFIYLCFALPAALIKSPQSYDAWRDFIMMPVMNIATSLLFIALLMHAWVGIRDVILDYVHQFSLRLLSLAAVALMLLAMGLWVLRVLMIVTLT